MNYADLTQEQKGTLAKCHTTEEALELAREEGHELTDEELESIVGGISNDDKLPPMGDDRETPPGFIPPPLKINPY